MVTQTSFCIYTHPPHLVAIAQSVEEIYDIVYNISPADSIWANFDGQLYEDTNRHGLYGSICPFAAHLQSLGTVAVTF